LPFLCAVPETVKPGPTTAPPAPAPALAPAPVEQAKAADPAPSAPEKSNVKQESTPEAASPPEGATVAATADETDAAATKIQAQARRRAAERAVETIRADSSAVTTSAPPCAPATVSDEDSNPVRGAATASGGSHSRLVLA
jgi:hypothetical protein